MHASFPIFRAPKTTDWLHTAAQTLKVALIHIFHAKTESFATNSTIMIPDSVRRGPDPTIETVNQDDDYCYDCGKLDVKMTKRVTFADQLVTAVDTPITYEHNHSLQNTWYSNEEEAQSEKAASAEASRLAHLKASCVRFAENDYYEVIGLEVRSYVLQFDASPCWLLVLTHLSFLHNIITEIHVTRSLTSNYRTTAISYQRRSCHAKLLQCHETMPAI